MCAVSELILRHIRSINRYASSPEASLLDGKARPDGALKHPNKYSSHLSAASVWQGCRSPSPHFHIRCIFTDIFCYILLTIFVMGLDYWAAPMLLARTCSWVLRWCSLLLYCSTFSSARLRFASLCQNLSFMCPTVAKRSCRKGTASQKIGKSVGKSPRIKTE
jgi:hypothetical protein